MQDNQDIVEYQLDALTRTTRFIAGVAPKTMARLGLGVTLAIDDAANDPAGELLGVKLGQGATALASTVGTIAKATGSKTASLATSMLEGIRTGRGRVAASNHLLDKVPALKGAREFVGQAVGEVGNAWNAAGYVSIEVENANAVEAPTMEEDTCVLPGLEIISMDVDAAVETEGDAR